MSRGPAWVWVAGTGVHPGPLGCVDTPVHWYVWFITEYTLWAKKPCPLDHFKEEIWEAGDSEWAWIASTHEASACPGAPDCLRYPHAGRTQECLKRHPKPGELLQGVQNVTRHTLNLPFALSPGFFHYAIKACVTACSCVPQLFLHQKLSFLPWTWHQWADRALQCPFCQLLPKPRLTECTSLFIWKSHSAEIRPGHWWFAGTTHSLEQRALI